VVITLLTIAVIATIGTINGHGPLVAENLNESLLTAQAFICVMSITVLGHAGFFHVTNGRPLKN
jgi:hypothetical protein